MKSSSETGKSIEIDLRKVIMCGLSNACEINRDFNKFDYADLKPEYLLTCNVAESILRQFPELIIKLEDNSKNFHKDSINKRSDLMSYFKALKNRKLFNGRLDIGLYNEEREAICPIELKLVNPQKTRIKKDIKRILSCLDNESNLNLVKTGYFAFVRQPMKCFVKTDMEQHVSKTKEWIDSYLQINFRKEIINYEFSTMVESIWDNFLFNDYDELKLVDEFELSEELNENIHFIGTVVKISTKNIST